MLRRRFGRFSPKTPASPEGAEYTSTGHRPVESAYQGVLGKNRPKRKSRNRRERFRHLINPPQAPITQDARPMAF
jgi:hypothetical protein